MTANERFFALGRLDEYSKARSRRDRTKMIEIYGDAEIANAEKCVGLILAQIGPAGE
jgi:hypothetical protein